MLFVYLITNIRLTYNIDKLLKGYKNTIVSEGFKGGTRGAPIMPRDAVSRTANVERNDGHKWVNEANEVPIHIYIYYSTYICIEVALSRIKQLLNI